MTPTSQDWKEFAGLDWSEIPKCKIIDQIEDTDIRHAAYFYSEIAEHTERIKATAMFYRHAQANTILSATLLNLWIKNSCQSQKNAYCDQPTQYP